MPEDYTTVLLKQSFKLLHITSDMFKSPAADCSNSRNSANFDLENLAIHTLSPRYLPTVEPRSKPRINASCSPSSIAYHGSQIEKLDSKIERERKIYSKSKRDEARIRKELEESKVMGCFVTTFEYFALTISMIARINKDSLK